TNEWAASNERAPTLAPSSTVHPLATRHSSSSTAPWTTHRWATVAPGPTSVGAPGGPWTIEPSWTLAPARTMTGEKSALRTAPYQTEASASTTTSPTSVAVGATKASGWTW